MCLHLLAGITAARLDMFANPEGGGRDDGCFVLDSCALQCNQLNLCHIRWFATRAVCVCVEVGRVVDIVTTTIPTAVPDIFQLSHAPVLVAIDGVIPNDVKSLPSESLAECII